MVAKFLEDPGYADASGIRSIQAAAPDVFTAHMQEQYFELRWPKHLAMLGVETVFHTVALSLTGTLVGLVLSGAVRALAVWLQLSLVLIWFVALYVEFAWCGGVTQVVRHSLLSGRPVRNLDVDQQLQLAAAKFRSWRRPLAWLVAHVLRWRYRSQRREADKNH